MCKFMFLITVSLPEPEKMRDGEANEDAKLTEFQVELVQLCAVLKGDYKDGISLEKLVENMKVKDATGYMDVAFKQFCDDCRKAKEEGKDDSYIVCDKELSSCLISTKHFVGKICSCFLCEN